MSGKHRQRWSDMDDMTPAEKAEMFDNLYEENKDRTPPAIVDQWNESVKRRDEGS